MDSGIKLTNEAKQKIENYGKEGKRDDEYLLLKIVKEGKKDVVKVVSEVPKIKRDSFEGLSEDEINKELWKGFMDAVTDKNVETGKETARFGINYCYYENKNKVVFVYWCHETAPVKERMIYSSTKDSVRKPIQNYKMIEAGEKDDLKYNVVVEAIKKK